MDGYLVMFGTTAGDYPVSLHDGREKAIAHVDHIAGHVRPALMRIEIKHGVKGPQPKTLSIVRMFNGLADGVEVVHTFGGGT